MQSALTLVSINDTSNLSLTNCSFFQETVAYETPKKKIRMENPLKAKLIARKQKKEDKVRKNVDLSAVVSNPRSLRQYK